MAVDKGYIMIAEQLLQAQAIPNVSDVHKETSLYRACSSGN